MSFLESPRLDPLITKGARSEIEWKRDFVYTRSGRVAQDFLWSHAKHHMEISYRARPKTEYDELRDFFNVVFRNGHIGFRAKDWSDFELTQANSALYLVDGADWQICRLHAAGASFYLRPTKKPVSDSVTIFRTRADVVSEATATIDYTTGIATISGHADGDTYTAEGEFDIPVTFTRERWVTNLQGTSADMWLSPEPIELMELPL